LAAKEPMKLDAGDVRSGSIASISDVRHMSGYRVISDVLDAC